MKPNELPEKNEIRKAVRDTLRNWHRLDIPVNPYLLTLHIVNATNADTGSSQREAVRNLLTRCLQQLAASNQTGATILNLRFWEKKIAEQVALELNMSRDIVNRKQRKALDELVEILVDLEREGRETAVSTLANQLPLPTYEKLFGHHESIAALLTWLTMPNAPWLIGITGLGGIGKTALADAAARRYLQKNRVVDVVWVHLAPQTMSGLSVADKPDWAWEQVRSAIFNRLPDCPTGLTASQEDAYVQQRLQSEPYLLIIDNIEETAVATYLCQQVSSVTNPTKCILTTRSQPSPQPNLRLYALSELNQQDSLALLRYQAEQYNLPDLADAEGDQLLPVYSLTGGNPLALKLVAGLVQTMPLPTVLSQLAESMTGPPEEMYRHIYWQSWQALTPDARTLLEAMPLIGDRGAKPEQMQGISQLDEGPFWSAVRELAARSLLEVRGSVWERRYGIHRLTETFLQTEIIHWPFDDHDHSH